VETATTGAAWRLAGRYLTLLLAANLAWEVAQLPLYTLWNDGSLGEIAWAVLHCTAGDGVIGAATLSMAVVLTRARDWPRSCFGQVAAVATLLGVAVTVALEWLNVEVWRNWAYAEAMPRLWPLGTGLSPVLQWLLLPPVCLLAARRITVPLPALGGRP
jgi:hypothetical protein